MYNMYCRCRGKTLLLSSNSHNLKEETHPLGKKQSIWSVVFLKTMIYRYSRIAPGFDCAVPGWKCRYGENQVIWFRGIAENSIWQTPLWSTSSWELRCGGGEGERYIFRRRLLEVLCWELNIENSSAKESDNSWQLWRVFIQEGNNVILLVRSISSNFNNVRFINWDGRWGFVGR